MDFTFDLVQDLLDWYFRAAAITPPTDIYLGLYTDVPDRDGSGTEVTGGTYARQIVTFDAADADGILYSDSIVTFPVASTNWGLTIYGGLHSAVSGANLKAYAPLQNPRSIGIGETMEFAAGEIAVTIRRPS